MRERAVKRGVKIAMIAIVGIAVCGFVVMSLWNWLAPAIFGGRTIDFWQALGIFILSKILFGGFRGRPGFGGHWRGRMRDRLEQMTPEERDKFRQGMADRCGRAFGLAKEPASPGSV
jgi:hypothetical protein